MAETERFQLTASSAEIYERQKVPSIFAPLAEATLSAIELSGRRRILDLACGSGAVARALLARTGADVSITGADLNDGMLAVAAKKAPPAEGRLAWVKADAGALPFADAAFDLALCQQGLQFFPDKPAAMAELQRVLAPGGRIAITVWSRVGEISNAIGEAAERRVGAGLHARAIAPFTLRDPAQLRALVEGAGFRDATFSEIRVMRVLDPALEGMRDEIRGSPYYETIAAGPKGALEAIAEDACAALTPYLHAETLTVPQYTHLIEATA